MRRWSHLVPPGASVLDVACGSGRHVEWFVARGGRVTGVDRDAAALQALASRLASQAGVRPELVVADIETGPWPFAGRRFDAVVVTNYLWRSRLADVVASVGPGGVLIYETFAAGHETIGRPSNPDFLLRPGELVDVVRAVPPGLRVVAFEDGFDPASPRFVQRIVALREPLGAAPGTRHSLTPETP